MQPISSTTRQFLLRHPNYYPEENVAYPGFTAAAGAGATLHDLVAHGAQHRVQACRIVGKFFDELEQVDEMPVLVALDGVNAYDDVSGYLTPEDRQPIGVEQLVFAKEAGRFRLRGPKHGMSLLAHSSTARNTHSGTVFEVMGSRREMQVNSSTRPRAKLC